MFEALPEAPAREEQVATLLSLLPFGRAEVFRVVELASGEGMLSHAILEAFPAATVLALDALETYTLGKDDFKVVIEASPPFRDELRRVLFARQ